MKRHSPMFAQLREPVSPRVEERFMDRDQVQIVAAAVPPHPELWGGLERDLARLQGLLDGAVEKVRDAFARVAATVDTGAATAEERHRIGGDVRIIMTSLQFHDIASQMIANMRSRAALLELAALVAAPGEVADEHARLLNEAARLAERCPDDAWSDQGGDIELF